MEQKSQGKKANRGLMSDVSILPADEAEQNESLRFPISIRRKRLISKATKEKKDKIYASHLYHQKNFHNKCLKVKNLFAMLLFPQQSLDKKKTLVYNTSRNDCKQKSSASHLTRLVLLGSRMNSKADGSCCPFF